MSMILDAGAFVAVERGDRDIAALIKRERLSHRVPRTHGGIVAQVWRGGAGRQALLALLLRAVDTVPLDEDLGRRAGMLLGAAGTADAIDSALICLAANGDRVLTSDAHDLRVLAHAANLHVDLVPV